MGEDRLHVLAVTNRDKSGVGCVGPGPVGQGLGATHTLYFLWKARHETLHDYLPLCTLFNYYLMGRRRAT